MISWMRAGAGLAVVLTLLLPAAPGAAQDRDDAARRAELQARRDSLEDAVMQKLIHRLAGDLKLDAAQRAHVAQTLKASSERRHQLLRQSAMLRGRMYRAVRSSGTTDAEFLKLVEESHALRQREHAVWEEDMETLARVLSPRQRVQFIVSWADFHEDMREVISREMREGQRRSERDRL